MIASITPLVQAANNLSQWKYTLLAYAIGSAAASACVGAVIGYFGQIIGSVLADRNLVLTVLALGLASIELGLVRRPRPKIQRQTQKLWRARYGPIAAAFLWGADIGLGVSTRITFASYWILVAACSLNASPLTGSVLMGGYGAGRAVLVAAGPILVERRSVTAHGEELFQDEAAWHRLHGWTLVAMAALLLLVKPA